MKHAALVQAYETKALRKAEYTLRQKEERSRRIRPLSPLAHHPDAPNLLASAGGSVVMGSPVRHVERTQDTWWKKHPTLAGEGQTPVQQKLSSPETFTGMYKARFEPPEVVPFSVTGDLVSNPRRAMKLLRFTAPKDLTIPTRACDFRTEVEWRLMLRNAEE